VSALEETMQLHLRAIGLDFEREYRFHKVRKWRFDFAIPDLKIGIECEGGIYSGGRHVRGNGFEADCFKYNQAALDGWRVLRFTKSMIDSGAAIAQIELAVVL
jgi:very-short-patch-repair endonuclease